MTVETGSMRIETFDTIVYRFVEDFVWRFAIEKAKAIDAHWESRIATRPHLFNGRVLLMHGADTVAQAGQRCLAGTCFSTDYKSFLAWRETGFPDAAISNVFSMAALRSADGAFLLGEMAATTANAGRIYFPAGTPDLNDLKDGFLDLAGSVIRELKEETGIDAQSLRPDPGWTVVFDGAYVACMKTIRSPLSAAELVAYTDAFLGKEKDPELVRLKPVFSPDDFDEERMPEFMRAYMQHVWREGG